MASPPAPATVTVTASDAPDRTAAALAANACEGIPLVGAMMRPAIVPVDLDEEISEDQMQFVIRPAVEAFMALRKAPATAAKAETLDSRWSTLLTSLRRAAETAEFLSRAGHAPTAEELNSIDLDLDIARGQCELARGMTSQE